MSRTITFQPDEDVKRMLERAVVGPHGEVRGTRSKIINNAVREILIAKGYARKKESTGK